MEDYVDITRGRVYFRPLNNGMVNRALIHSTLKGDILNHHMFFVFIELDIIRLRKKHWRLLTPEDGQKIKDKTKEILTRHGILKYVETKTVVEDKGFDGNVFTEADKKIFSEQSKNAEKIIGEL